MSWDIEIASEGVFKWRRTLKWKEMLKWACIIFAIFVGGVLFYESACSATRIIGAGFLVTGGSVCIVKLMSQEKSK
jgi:hypothetical protein